MEPAVLKSAMHILDQCIEETQAEIEAEFLEKAEDQG